jgi:hypothetical protein
VGRVGMAFRVHRTFFDISVTAHQPVRSTC